jgi:hypothetical protein
MERERKKEKTQKKTIQLNPSLTNHPHPTIITLEFANFSQLFHETNPKSKDLISTFSLAVTRPATSFAKLE